MNCSFRNILGEKFKSGCCLKFSTKWDSVQSVCIADVDFDGENEIVIGTFGCVRKRNCKNSIKLMAVEFHCY